MANCVENMVKSTVSCIFPISFSDSPLSKRGTSCAWLGYFIGKHWTRRYRRLFCRRTITLRKPIRCPESNGSSSAYDRRLFQISLPGQRAACVALCCHPHGILLQPVTRPMCYSRFRTSRLSRQLPEAGVFVQLHHAACFSSMRPVCRRALRQLKCLASLVVPAAHGVLAQPTQKYSVQPFQAIVTHGGFESPTVPAFAAGGRFTCQGATPAKTHVH